MTAADAERGPGAQRLGSTLRARVRHALARDHDVPLSFKLVKAARWAEQRLVSPWVLADCDVVGPGARTRGRPVILNAGRIELGARTNLMSIFAPLVLATEPRGELVLGDDVLINFGARISAARSVRIGDRVMIAPYSTIDDRDVLPGGEAAGARDGAAPIVIGDDVWLGARVRVRAGAVIGARTVVGAGSEVRGELPADVVAGGVPARVLRPIAHAAAGEQEREDESVRRATLPRDVGPRANFAQLAHLAHGAHGAVTLLHARLALRAVDRLGARPHVRGAPFVENLGRIEIGDDLLLDAGPIRSHLVTGPGALLRIGDGVVIGAAAAIAAMRSIEIGDGAHLGRAAMLLDSDFHGIDRREDEGASAPIVIGAGAWIGDEVTIVRGAHIGARAHVASGSTVFGAVAEGAWFETSTPVETGASRGKAPHGALELTQAVVRDRDQGAP
jgi:maltose O-acetyltransferase